VGGVTAYLAEGRESGSLTFKMHYYFLLHHGEISMKRKEKGKRNPFPAGPLPKFTPASGRKSSQHRGAMTFSTASQNSSCSFLREKKSILPVAKTDGLREKPTGLVYLLKKKKGKGRKDISEKEKAYSPFFEKKGRLLFYLFHGWKKNLLR